MKMDVTLEPINANDLQARITAAIQSGSGADIILMLHNWPHLYANALADVSELAEWKARDQGGYYPHNEAAARAGDRKSTRLNSSHSQISYAVFCLKKKKKQKHVSTHHTT